MNRTPESKKTFVSLSTQLIVPVIALVMLVTAGVYLGLVRTSRTMLMSSKQTAADMVVKLTALSVVPAVVFGDEEEMTRSVNDLARNPDVTDVELWDVDPKVRTPLASVHRPQGKPIGRPSSAARARVMEPDAVRLVEPIVAPEGKTVGVLAVRISTTREEAALADLAKRILYVSVATALCLALAIFLVIRNLVALPLRRLRHATRQLADGERNLDESVRPRKIEDEVVGLAKEFADMAEQVRDREARLAIRNSELSLILNSVDQGFLTALPDGRLLPERSAIVETWLGKLEDDTHIWELIGRLDPRIQDWAEMAWLQLVDGILPLEVGLEQLPKRLGRDGRHYELAYHPVMRDEELDRVVIVLTDVTVVVEREQAVALQHEFSVLVDQFVRDRRAFYDFWNEASELVKKIVASRETPTDSLRRNIHTLKGNARFFGLKRLSQLCHSIEDAMQERGENTILESECDQLEDVWGSLRVRIEPLMRGATAFIDVSRDEYQRLLGAIQARSSHRELEQLVRGLRQEPTEWRLRRAGKLLAEACKKLGKTPPEVIIDHHELRLPPGPWAPFWSVLPHVLNNAADHGVESDEERRAAGKEVPARIELSTTLSRSEFVVQIKDDGRGIDWERVRERAKKLKLPHRTPEELKQALFSDGFSLKTKVSELSGRGVGLAAVRTVVDAMSGRIKLVTELGKGTTLSFHFPPGRTAEETDADREPSSQGNPQMTDQEDP